MSRAFITKIGSFVPTQISGCQLWLDAADSTTLTGTSPVTQWRDKSGNARNTTSYAGTPALTTNAINSVQAINFNGSSSFTGSIPGSGTSYTLFFVGTFNNSTGTYGGFVCFGRSGTPDHVSGITNTKLTDSSMYSTIDSTNTAFTSNTLSTPFVYSLVIDGTFLNNFVNGNQQSPANVAKSASFNFTNYVVGDRAGSTSSIFLNGYVGEIIVFINGLAISPRQQVEGYLAQKWGLVSSLPAGHPGRSQTFYIKNPGIAAVPSKIMTIVPYGNYFPLSMPACGLWLDAADASTITYSSGSNLSQWRDKSGNGYIMSNNAGTTTVVANSLNSLNTVYTPSGTNTQITNFRGRTKMTFFIVGKCAAGKYLIAFNGGFLYLANDSLLYMYPPSGAYLDIIDSAGFAIPVVSNNTWFIICIGYDNATNSTANPYTINGSPANGTNRATTARGASGILADQFITNTLYINTVNGTNSYDSDFTAELIYYNTTLSVSQRQAVEGYLAWKWGLQSTNLPAGHPYYSTPPIEFDRPAQVAGIPLQIKMTSVPKFGNLPYYQVDSISWATNWQPYLQEMATLNSTATASLATYPVSGSTASYNSSSYGALAPNGLMYFIGGTGVFVLNPLTNSASILGSASTGSYSGLVLAPNGNLYGIPYGTGTVLVITPSATSPYGTVTTIGSGLDAYQGGCLGPNGTIYALPWSGSSILTITGNTVAQVAISPYCSTRGSVLGPDGNIYGCPWSSSAILKINTTTNTSSTIACDGGRYWGCCLAPNGLIYFSHFDSGHFAILNVSTNAVTTAGSPPSAYNNCIVLGPNGKLYLSGGYTNILEYNYNTNTYVTIGSTPGTNGSSINLAPNGNIYIPGTSATVGNYISFSGLSQLPNSNYCLSAYTNKF